MVKIIDIDKNLCFAMQKKCLKKHQKFLSLAIKLIIKKWDHCMEKTIYSVEVNISIYC